MRGDLLVGQAARRIASALLAENLLPAGAQRFRAVRSLVGRTLARTVRRPARPGASLALLDTVDAGEAPAWADGSPVGVAYAALLRAAMSGAALLGADDHDAVEAVLLDWDGSHPPLAPDGFPDRRERPGARLVLLAALAPYRITEEDVAAWRRPEHTDLCLVHLIAYGAFIAVDRIESSLSARTTLERP